MGRLRFIISGDYQEVPVYSEKFWQVLKIGKLSSRGIYFWSFTISTNFWWSSNKKRLFQRWCHTLEWRCPDHSWVMWTTIGYCPWDTCHLLKFGWNCEISELISYWRVRLIHKSVYQEQNCKRFAYSSLMLKISQAVRNDVTHCKPLVCGSWRHLMQKYSTKKPP